MNVLALVMMDCKKALSDADGDMEKAIEDLRKASGLKAAKKASRVAAEGVDRAGTRHDEQSRRLPNSRSKALESRRGRRTLAAARPVHRSFSSSIVVRGIVYHRAASSICGTRVRLNVKGISASLTGSMGC